MIQGVEAVLLMVREDDRGYLMEIIQGTDPTFTRFDQVYVVGDVGRSTIRAYHKHAELWDWFFISHGTARIVFTGDRPDSPTHGEMRSGCYA